MVSDKFGILRWDTSCRTLAASGTAFPSTIASRRSISTTSNGYHHLPLSQNPHHRATSTTHDGGPDNAGAAETMSRRHHHHMAPTRALTSRIALGAESLCPAAAPSFHNTSVRVTTALVNVALSRPNHWTLWKTTRPLTTTSRRQRPRIRHLMSPGLFLHDLNRLSTQCTS